MAIYSPNEYTLEIFLKEGCVCVVFSEFLFNHRFYIYFFFFFNKMLVVFCAYFLKAAGLIITVINFILMFIF